MSEIIRLRRKGEEPIFFDPKTGVVYLDEERTQPMPGPPPDWVAEVLREKPKKPNRRLKPVSEDTPIFVSHGVVEDRPSREIIKRVKDIV